MNKDAIHANRKDNWRTPPDIVQPLVKSHQLLWDLAATKEDKCCRNYIGPGHRIKGLNDLTAAAQADISTRITVLTATASFIKEKVKDQGVWVNCPYGADTEACKTSGNYFDCTKVTCEKRGYHLDEFKPGLFTFTRSIMIVSKWASRTFALLPCSPETEWWHEHIQGHFETFTRKGRISFIDPVTGKPINGNSGANVLCVAGDFHKPTLRKLGWVKL